MAALFVFFAIISGFIYFTYLLRETLPKSGIYVKTTATALLTLYALFSGNYLLLTAALALSAAGDAFLAADKEKWLLPGMGAFFMAHLLFIAHFYTTGLMPLNGHVIAIGILLICVAAALVAYLWNSLGHFKLPVVAYACVIIVMGTAAMLLPERHSLARVGAIMFIVSDIILSLELFKPHALGRLKRVTSPALWVLYFGGQVFIAEGMIGAAG